MNSAVGDRNVMGIAAQIFNDVCSAFKGFLEMGNPFLCVAQRASLADAET